jgi:MFS family permease
LFYFKSIDYFMHALGSVIAGSLMAKGRKISIMIAATLILLGQIPAFTPNWALILAGRFVTAIGVGIEKTS